MDPDSGGGSRCDVPAGINSPSDFNLTPLRLPCIRQFFTVIKILLIFFLDGIEHSEIAIRFLITKNLVSKTKKFSVTLKSVFTVHKIVFFHIFHNFMCAKNFVSFISGEPLNRFRRNFLNLIQFRVTKWRLSNLIKCLVIILLHYRQFFFSSIYNDETSAIILGLIYFYSNLQRNRKIRIFSLSFFSLSILFLTYMDLYSKQTTGY